MESTYKKRKIKIIAKLMCLIMIFSSVYIPQCSVHATQNRMGNYSTAFSLSGNGADDIVSVAKAQIGKTGSQLGYSEEWCADFVGDCAALANQGSAIPRNGRCIDLQNTILNAGGQTVSINSACKGDIAFYGKNGSSHVEIIYANNGGKISTIGGNSGNWSDCYSRRVRDHSSQTMTITKVIRPNYGSNPKILPGEIASGWNVPTTVTASHRITTYNEYGKEESNHYIDPGDSCYISEVYSNGFVKVQYPVSGGKRWSFAKTSDFSLTQVSNLPDTSLHVWFSSDKMGGEASGIRLGENIYLCYRLETVDGNLLDPAIGNYAVKETIYYPNGDSFPYTYDNNNNWISSQLTQWGTYRGVVEISGDYTGSVEVSYTVKKPDSITFNTWFSDTAMGKEVSYMEKGKLYYLCYSIICDKKDYFNKYANIDYSVTEEVYGPDGKKVYGYTYDKSDNNWIRFIATQTGTYKGVSTLKGFYNSSLTETCTCKNLSTPKLKDISITTYPKKMVYTVGEALDLKGMVVEAYYTNNTKKVISDYKITGETYTSGCKTVTVSYTEGGITKSKQFTITVNEKPKEMVTITYDAKGGNLSPKKQTGEKNTYAVLLTEKPVKNIKISFDANGGNDSPDNIYLSQNFIDWVYFTGSVNAHYQSGGKFLMRENCTLSACYEPAVIKSLPIVHRDGYSFEGWYTQDGVKVSSDTKITENCTLVAKWKEDIVQEENKIEYNDEKFDTDDNIDDYEEYDESIEDEIEVGDEITTDEAVYTVTSIGAVPCVEFSELFDDDVTKDVIPDTIEDNGIIYKVTSIASKAFYKNKKIRQVTIGRNVSKIGSYAFYGCTSLNRIIIKSEKLKSGSIGSKAFTKIAKNVKVYVPGTMYVTYKKILKKAGIGTKAKIYKKNM